jgi:hypothetical protein
MIVSCKKDNKGGTNFEKWTTYIPLDGSSNNSITGIASDIQGNACFSTYDGQLVYNDTIWTTFVGPRTDDFYTGIAIVSHGNKWFFTSNGFQEDMLAELQDK